MPANGCEFSLGRIKFFQNWIVVMVARLREYSKNRCIVHFKKGEFYGTSIIVNKTVFLKKVFYSIGVYTYSYTYEYVYTPVIKFDINIVSQLFKLMLTSLRF